MTAAARTSRWVRGFVFVGAVFFVLSQAALVAGSGERTGVILGLCGFVFHTVFGKAYSLVPAYFDRTLATNRLLPVHLTASAGGTLLLAAGVEWSNGLLETVGATVWAVGVGLFLITLCWTLRGNLTGAETATGTQNTHRKRVDRISNLFIPVALAYLAVGSYELLASTTALPPIFDGYAPRATHLLAAGSAGLMLFAVGFRLLPRFLVAPPPRPLVWVVLPTGALGPTLLAWGLPTGTRFQVGALMQTTAVVGFAVAFWALYWRSDRRRVGFYGVLAATVAGVLAVALGVGFAFGTPPTDLFALHRRLTVLGFLGLAIVGVSYQFYPPTVGQFPGASDRTATYVIGALFGGLLVETAGWISGYPSVVTLGRLSTLVGAVAHLYLLAGLFRQRRRR